MNTKKLITLLIVALLISIALSSCAKGEPGLSAYEIYLKYHPEYTGSEEEWINSVAGNLGKDENQQTEEITAGETGLFVFAQNNDGVSYTLVAYTGVDRRVDVPESYRGCPVTIIGHEAFRKNEYVETVYLPDTVTHIEWGVFDQCYIKALYIPTSVVSIDDMMIHSQHEYDIFYAGTKEQWSKIDMIGQYDHSFESAVMHYEIEP